MQVQNEQLIEGRYLLKGLLHRYGTVELYEALDTQLDRVVTVQRLTDDGAVDPGIAGAFLRHQQIAASIHDCPLMTVYDAGEWDGRPFSVMERDKGRPPGALYRPGYPPEVSTTLKAVRQAADALRCCREAGLHDWVFSPEAVSVNSQGNSCLAIVEGLGGPRSSASAETDVVALGALLRIMLLGDDGLVPHGAALALVPPGVRTLLARTEPGARNRFRTGNEVAAAISALERVAYQPTEAYEPGPAQSTGASASDTAVLPVVEPSWEAPTMAAPVAAAVEIVPAPYLPPPTPVQEVQRRSPRWLALLAGASGLLLLLLLGIALLGRERPARAIADAPASPTEQTVKVATVPDLRGRNLEDARQLLGSLGLNLAEGDALNDARIAPDTIVRQQPDPSSQTNTGSVVTVSLSLGPAPTPTAAPQPAPPAQVVPPQPPAVEAPTQPPAKGKKDKKGNGDGDD